MTSSNTTKNLESGTIIQLKKTHPCGANAWEILRTGMDFRLKCCGCGRQVIIPRKQIERSFRGFTDYDS